MRPAETERVGGAQALLGNRIFYRHDFKRFLEHGL